MEREGSHYLYTQDRIYISYNIQPFYGSLTFMAHYDYEWSLTPQRGDTEWLLLAGFYTEPWTPL